MIWPHGEKRIAVTLKKCFQFANEVNIFVLYQELLILVHLKRSINLIKTGMILRY